jgi:DNA polymerase
MCTRNTDDDRTTQHDEFPDVHVEDKFELLEALREEYANCDRCDLCDPDGRNRTNVVFGEGDSDASLMIVGEAPGKHEDLVGEPFVGRAGDLFDKLLGSFRLDRQEVFITNVVCCRPTEKGEPNKNRKPTKEEVNACKERLHRTIEVVDPLVILMLGDSALKTLTKATKGITTIARNGKFPRQDVVTAGIFGPVTRCGFATFHPSYLLRNERTEVGSDMHRSYECWKKAIRLTDRLMNVYYDVPIPDRGHDDDE